MRGNQSQQSGETITNAQAFNILFFFLAGYAACFWPFMRKDFGVRAFHISGAAAMLVMLLYMAFRPCPEMLFVFRGSSWFVLVLYHRVAALRNASRGWEVHSTYDGDPWLVMRCLWAKPSDDFSAKVVAEPIVLIIAGMVINGWSQPFAEFIFFGAVPLIVKKAIERGIENTQVRVMRDKAFEMRARAERFRHRR